MNAAQLIQDCIVETFEDEHEEFTHLLVSTRIKDQLLSEKGQPVKLHGVNVGKPPLPDCFCNFDGIWLREDSSLGDEEMRWVDLFGKVRKFVDSLSRFDREHAKCVVVAKDIADEIRDYSGPFDAAINDAPARECLIPGGAICSFDGLWVIEDYEVDGIPLMGPGEMEIGYRDRLVPIQKMPIVKIDIVFDQPKQILSLSMEAAKVLVMKLRFMIEDSERRLKEGNYDYPQGWTCTDRIHPRDGEVELLPWRYEDVKTGAEVHP